MTHTCHASPRHGVSPRARVCVSYNRKVLPLNLEKLRTAQNRAMKERMNVIYYAIEVRA